MKNQRGLFDSFLIQIIAGAVGLAVVTGGFLWLKHKYDNSIRAPLETIIAERDAALEKLGRDIAANKREAARLLAEEQAKNAANAAAWSEYAKKENESYEKQIQEMRDRVNVAPGPGLVFHDPGHTGRGDRCGGAKTETEGGAGVPADPAAGSRISDETRNFLYREALTADETALYADKARDIALACLRGDP